MKEEIALLVLGWLFGLLSPAIINAIKDRREIAKLKEALMTELDELKYRLMLMVYHIESKHGAINHDFFKWAQNILNEYNGINSSETLLGTIGPLLKLTNEEMETYSQYAQQKNVPNSGIALKKYSMALLESNLTSLSKFDAVLRGHLLEIKTHIGFINEIVDDTRFYFQLSFQNGISPTNYEIANTNMIDSYKNYSSQARVVIELIRKIMIKK